MVAKLANISIQLLGQIAQMSQQLNADHYSEPLPLLSGNTIGKHVRHVYELFYEMLQGVENDRVNYDARKRSLLIEEDIAFSNSFVEDLCKKLELISNDKNLILSGNYGAHADVNLNTTLGRELAYNIEHAIHHMAILQICMKHYFAYVQLPENFGVAFSTQKFLKENVHA
ncbi:MAG: hypothetical protein K9H61_11440 [Bacteroidia bacterium]|nr:hypothetical protein [Bacteroidia bacterium]MCF8426960.1 hypothetical protein [Bacteroidia bacterium]MCF8447601.1 hypothetical protein [Bacteroidia bacterium]